jgi:hypothetical protein
MIIQKIRKNNVENVSDYLENVVSCEKRIYAISRIV